LYATEQFKGYFGVEALITGARKSKGYRYSIYKCAEECHAVYTPGGSASSIYYKVNEDDLHIRLLFRTLDRAEDFQTKLNIFASEHPHFAQKLSLSRSIRTWNITDEPERVLRTDYNSDDNTDSPEMSLNNVLSDSATIVSLYGDVSRTLQALEDTKAIAILGVSWYRCHLIPDTSKDTLKNDPDNFIYASWTFHQHLDGLNTPSGIGIAIALDSEIAAVREEVLVNDNYEYRDRVSVLLYFEDINVANVFQTLLKQGTERLGDSCFRSFVHVRSASKFSKCVAKKLRDQKQKSEWVKNLGIV
jgi:hypothetical protein